MQKSIEKIWSDLEISKMETATDEELQADGYHGKRASAQVISKEEQMPRDALPKGVLPVDERKPHAGTVIRAAVEDRYCDAAHALACAHCGRDGSLRA